MAVRASRTSSSLNGLMIAITIFMGPIPAWARFRQTGRSRLRFTTRRKFTTRAQPAPIESNAVPDRPHSLTDYERGPFRGLLNSDAPALFGRAQNLVTPDQLTGKTGSRHNLAHREGRRNGIWMRDFIARPRRAAKCRGLPVHVRGEPAAAPRLRRTPSVVAGCD